MLVSTRSEDSSRPNRRLLLVLSLFGLLAVYPYLSAGPVGQIALVAANGFTLVAGVYAVSDRRRDVAVAALLAVGQIGSAVFNLVAATPWLESASLALLVLFYAFTVFRTLQFTFADGIVDSDRLYAAVAAYLLLGFIFGALYSLADRFIVGAFSIEPLDFRELMYFSFVTLTSLGYGDIAPACDEVQSLAVIEAVGGTLYLALLVARLVGMSVSPPRE